jgi:K+-transporting ATPase KdpF subunit
VTLLYIVGGIAVLLLLAYLFYALIMPERL